ncbi:MAG: PilT/PilU family type 4a pilus ATPase [Candidatus Omnitrophota bacterium]
MDENDNSLKEERRRAPRLAVGVEFKYTIFGSGETANLIYTAVTKNISASGLLFENLFQVPIDTDLKVVLNMPGVPPQTIAIETKVMRIEKLALGYNIGIVFVNISEAQKEDIRKRIERMNVLKLLERVNKKEISDIHLTVNSPPMIRYYGNLKPLDNDLLSGEEIKQMVYSMLSEEQRKNFNVNKDLDFAYSPLPELRFRVNIYQQRGMTEVVFRNVSANIQNREELGLSDVIDDLCQLKSGIIFVSGPTGSGKSTTIATMIDIINRQIGGVILSLEKPIEYLHTNIKAIVKQREVGIDVPTFAIGVKTALRQDPDVIVVGEILDCDTIETALQAAETGHLVITSIHATDTVQVLERIMSFFPAQQHEFVCARLSHSLRAIINQRLLPHNSGIGRVLACEVCVVNTALKRIIANRNFTQLPSIIQTGSKLKMQLLQDSVVNLFERGLINAETYELYTKKQG